LFRRNRIAQRLDVEIQFHLEQQIAENIATGMSREEARYAALRTFGNPTVLKEESRDTWGWLRLEQMGQDLRYAFRTLRKSGGFTATAILTLALGIGANTAIFQLLDAVRLRSLPVSTPQSLALVQIKGGNHGFGISNRETSLTYQLFEQLRAHQEVFSGIFAWSGSDEVAVGQGSQQRRAQALWLTGNTFAVLGVNSIRGRLFTDEDHRPDCGISGVVISYGFWQSAFGGRDSAIGSKLLIQGHPAEVLGVTPPDFFGLEVGNLSLRLLPQASGRNESVPQVSVLLLIRDDHGRRGRDDAAVRCHHSVAPTGHSSGASSAVPNDHEWRQSQRVFPRPLR
jgi:hypothetical protein